MAQEQISQSQIVPGTIKERHLVVTTTIANGDMVYGDGNNNWQRLAIGSTGQILQVFAGIPTWTSFIPPKYTTTQRNAIANPVAGQIIFNTSTNKLNFYNGSAWEVVTSA